MFDTPRAALQALTDDTLLERVAVRVLRVRYPELRITGPSGDLGRDAFGRRLFGEHDEIVVWVSCEDRWTDKLTRDRASYEKLAPAARPAKAIFVTTRSTRSTDQKRYKDETRRKFGIALEIVDLNELAGDLESDELHRVAEFDLGVRPRMPRVLQPPAVLWENLRASIPGIESPLVGREGVAQQLRSSLDPASDLATGRIVVVEGPGGIGKTRLAVEVADSCATTLVAGTGVPLLVESLVDVPLQDPSIVVVDDAHRSPNLTGLAAMFQDPRFARVKVVLTVRPGTASRVLASMGQERAAITTVRLEPLARGEIDRIVIGHGLNEDGFRLHVVEIAEGNPGLAHAACHVALSQTAYHWTDTAALLSDLVNNRLLHVTSDQDEHRAAAVALALLTTANDGEQLAALAGAVTMLPHEPHRLDILLEDLSDAGVAVGQPYTLRPDVVASVLAAAALDPQARVQIKLASALKALGRAASWSDPDDAPSGDRGLLGIAPLPPNSRGRSLRIHSTRLAAQLAVLAQAGWLRRDTTCLTTLYRAVRELLSVEADFDNWLDVLTLTAQVAPTTPTLLGELRDALVRQWPPTLTADLWDDDPGRRYRFDTKTFLEQAVAVAEQVGRVDPVRAVRWVLEVVWLSYPVLGESSLDFVRRAISSLVKVNRRASAETWDQAFARRQQVLDTILRWGRDRYAGPPNGLAPDEREVRDPAVAAHVQLTALRPLLSVVTEDHALGTPDDKDTFVWTHYVLPDDLRTSDGLSVAVETVEAMLDQLDLHSLAARGVLEGIAGLPRELRAEGARGLSDKPMPDYAVNTLNAAAVRVSDALASHWEALPLTIRRTAAEASARAGGRPASTLAELAEAGDPVATAAVADVELNRLLIVVPVELDLHWRAQSGQDADFVLEDFQQRAVQLGEQVSLDEALELLRLVDSPPQGPFATQCLDVFASTVGSRAPDAEAVLTRLAEGPFLAAASLLAGLLGTHPGSVIEWLFANIAVSHIAELAVIVADKLPAEREIALLSAIVVLLTCTTDAQAASADTPVIDTGDDRSPNSATDVRQARHQIVQRVSWHLVACRLPGSDRLALLVQLGTNVSADSLTAVLGSVGHILTSTLARGAVSADVAPGLRSRLVTLLGRALGENDCIVGSDVDDDIAFAGVALAKVAPDEVADLLIERLHAGERPAIPFTWRKLLTELPFEQREPLALAFQERVEVEISTGGITGETEATALAVLSHIAAGTASWIALARRLAAGNEADRARAARVLRHCWRDSTWHDLVPDLLDAGLDEVATAELRNGLMLDDVGATSASDIQVRLTALQPLLADTRRNVHDFATEVKRNLNALADFMRR